MLRGIQARRDAARLNGLAVVIAAAVVGICPNQAAAQSAPNLVAAYAYDEASGTTASDGSVSGNTATVTGTAWNAAGKFATCLSFNGVSSFVESPDLDALTPGIDATFEAWVFLASEPGETVSIYNKWSQTGEDEYLFGINPGRTLYFAWHTTGGNVWASKAYNAVNGVTAIPLNTLTHVAVVRSGATLTFYINGTLDAAGSVMDTNPFRNGLNALRIGGQGRGAKNRFLNGRIDEVRLYNRALTQIEIQNDLTTPIGPVSDTTSPAVSITTPGNGTAVSATTTVNVTATDNVGVAGVQLRLDDVAVGAQDVAAPYVITWNTTTAPDGNHTLTVVARDVAGNETISVPVSVIVANGEASPVNLVAAYGYDEGSGLTSVDASIGSNTATLSGATWGTACQFGPCLAFNGASSFVEAADLDVLTPGTVATFEAWVMLTSAPAETVSVFNKWGQTADDEYLFGINPARTLYFAWHTTGGNAWPSAAYNAVNSVGTIPLNALTHIAVVRNGATVRFYINGTFDSSGAVMDTNPFRNGANTLRLGGQGRGAKNRFLTGTIDEARVYNRGLSQMDIQNDMSTPIGPAAPDATPPGLSSIAVSAVTSSAATLTWATNEPSDTQLEYGLTIGYGNTTALNATLTTSHAIAVSGLAPATLYHLRVRSRDAAGNLARSADLTLTTLDTIPPTVAVTAPAPGVVVGTVTVRATATDNVGVVGVQFRLDGVSLGSEDRTAPYSVSWSTTAAVNGSHTLTAVARDAAGNVITSTPVSVTAMNDTTPPAIFGVAVSSITSSGAAVSWTTDEPSNSQVDYGLSTEYGSTSAIDASFVTSHAISLAGLDAGTLYHFGVRSRDAAGNLAFASDLTVTTIENTPPVVSIAAPSAGDTVSGTVTAMADATDNVEVAGVRFFVDGSPLGAEVTTVPYSVSWNSTATEDGDYSLTAVARDRAGNQRTSPPVGVKVKNDKTPPIVTNVAASTITASAATISWTTNEASDARVEYGPTTAYGSTSTLDTNLVMSHTITLSGLTSATVYHARIRTRDAALNLALSSDITFTTLDDTPPTISLTAPASGATVQGVTAVTAAATDNVGVIGVQFYLDGAPLGAEDMTSPYGVTWNTTTAANGVHTVTAVARDAAGLQTNSVATSITVDNDITAPAVSITTPVADATVSGAASITATATDNVAVTGVTLRLDGVNLGAELSAPPYARSWDSKMAGNGTHVLTAVARDAAGNVSMSAAVVVTVANDTTPPVITSVAASSITSLATTISWATDEPGDSQVEYGATTAYGSASPLDASRVTLHSITLNGLSSATLYHVRVRSRDAAGNLGISGDVALTTLDGTPPVVSITAPVFDATVSGTVTVTANATDNTGVVGVQFKLNGALLGAEDLTAPFTTAWDTTSVANGAHTLTAVARDAAGNVSASAAITVTVNNNTQADLVAAYSYNDGAGTTAADGSVHNNTATVSGTTWITACKSGKCLSFNGATSFVESADVAALTLATEATFEAWVSLSALPAETVSIFNKWNQTGDDEYIVGLSPARALYFAWQTTGGGQWPSLSFNEAASIATIPLNTLTHIAVVRSGATLTFFINGTPEPSLTVLDTNPFRNGVNTLRVGGQGRGGKNRVFPGAIDEVRIYKRALTQAEIQADMNAPIGPDTTPPVLSAIAASAVTSSSATIGWTTNESSDTQIEYGATTAYGSTTPLNGSLVTEHWGIVGPLAPTTLYHYRVRSRDVVGNLTVSGDYTVTTPAVDLAPPTVSVTAPVANSTVSGVVAVNANAADNVGVASVQFKLDGAPLGFADTTAPYTISWDTTGASVGSHTLTAVARDAAGNQATSTAVVVTVSRPLVTLAWDANTDVDLVGYKVYVGVAPGVYSTSIDVGNVTTYTVTGLEAGRRYYFVVTAYDQLGNESSVSNEVSTTP